MENLMRSTTIPTTLALGLLAFTAVPAAALMPADAAGPAASNVTPVQYYYPYQRPYYGGSVPPYLRGYEDPGYAYHGNVNGCAEDLGYGRWEPCDRGR
jgi:hypothetical protein